MSEETDMEVCWKCGATAPSHPLVLVDREAGEEHPLCHKCSREWLDSDESWPPETPQNQKPQKTP